MPADTGSGMMSTLIMIGLMVAVFYVLVIMPAKRRNTQQQQMVSTLQPGDRVITTAGIIGTIRHIGTNQLVVEISPGVEMTVTKQVVVRKVSPAEEEFEYADEETSETLSPEGADSPHDEASDQDPQAR